MKKTTRGQLHQLTWFPKLFPVNCYLVQEEDSLTLIDAALPFSVKGIVQAASAIGLPITRIILTHAHDDHVGALDGLKAALPDAAVYISERDSALLAGDRSLRVGEGNLPVRGGVPKKVKTRPDILLQDGDTVGSLTAIATPGHTPGSMSFLDRRSKALIVGDAFQTFRETAVAGAPVVLFPFPAMATWNREAAYRSAQKLLLTGPSLLAAGHGPMHEHPADIMERAIDKTRRQLGLAK